MATLFKLLGNHFHYNFEGGALVSARAIVVVTEGTVSDGV